MSWDPNITHATIVKKNNSQEFVWERADIDHYTEVLEYEIVGYADVLVEDGHVKQIIKYYQ